MDYFEKLREERICNEKVALALLQQCKDNGLTVGQTKAALNHAIELVEAAVRDHPIDSVVIHHFFQKDTQQI